MKGAIAVIAVAVVLLLLTGWYFLNKDNTDTPVNTTSQTQQTTDSSVQTTAPTPQNITTTDSTEPVGSDDPYVSEIGIDVFADEYDIADVDFSAAQNFSDSAAFYDYFEQCLKKRYKQIAVVFNLKKTAVPTEDYLIKRFSLPCCGYEMQYNDKIARVVFSVDYYVGDYIYDAYMTGDISKLNKKEKDAYILAKAFVDDSVAKCTDDWEKALMIAEYLCVKADYSSEKEQDALDDIHTVYGVLVNGKANCQGFTDAFYTLCRMAGLEAGKVTGEANSALHVWNTVKIDNKWYMTDVTWMETTMYKNGIYYGSFCTGKDYCSNDHIWTDDCLRENVVAVTDNNFYYTKTNKTLNSAQTFYTDIANLILAGNNTVERMTVGFNIDTSEVIAGISSAFEARGVSGSISASCYNLGENGFIIVKKS